MMTDEKVDAALREHFKLAEQLSEESRKALLDNLAHSLMDDPTINPFVRLAITSMLSVVPNAQREVLISILYAQIKTELATLEGLTQQQLDAAMMQNPKTRAMIAALPAEAVDRVLAAAMAEQTDPLRQLLEGVEEVKRD